MSRSVKYEGERSNVGGIEALIDVGGREIWMNDGSKWDEYDSSAATNSAQA